MKRNSLKIAVVALAATGLIALGVAAPANAETADPTVDDSTSTTVEEPGSGAKEELPAEVSALVQEARAEEVPASENDVSAPPVAQPEAPVQQNHQAPVAEAPAVPIVSVNNVGITSAEVVISASVAGGAVSGYTVRVYNEDRSIDLVDVANSAYGITFNGLTANTKFSLEVTATGPGGSNSYSGSFTTVESPVKAPSAPLITVVEASSNFITVKISDGANEAPNSDYPTRYSVAITLGDQVEVVTVNAPGTHTFENLTPTTEYIVSATASNIAGDSVASSAQVTTAEKKPVASPGRIMIRGMEVTADGAVMAVSTEAGGPVDSYVVTVSDRTGASVVKTSATPGAFKFTGLKSGLYSVTAEARGPAGATGVRGYFFFVPEAPNAVTASILYAGTDYLIGGIKSGETVPSVSGPIALPRITYTVVLTGGDIERTLTTVDNGTETGGRFAFGGLKTGTEYTVKITAENVAGSRTVTLNVSTEKFGEEPVTPAAPAPENLVDDARGGLEVPATAEAGAAVAVTVGEALAGQTVQGWLFSTPTDLGGAVVKANGIVTFIIPADIPAGGHRLAVTSANNALIGWGNIRVDAVDNGTALPVAPGPDNGQGTADIDNGAAAINNGAAAINNGITVTARNDADRLAATGRNFPTGVGVVGILAVIAGSGAIFFRRKAAAHAA